MINCEHCNSEFKTISSLNLHKKTAKYCLKKQKSSSNEVCSLNNTVESICKFCEKSFSINYIKTHVLTCNSYLEYRIKELENQLLDKDLEIKNLVIDKDLEIKNLVIEKDLEIKNLVIEKDLEIKKLHEENIKLLTENSFLKEDRVEDRQHIKEMNKNPITVNTNNISNSNNSSNSNNIHVNSVIEDISKIEETLENLNINHVINGQKGIANFAYKYLCTDENNNKTYLCTDPSRGFFKFINENNAVIKDISAKTLVRNLCRAGLVLKVNNIAHSSYTDENGIIDKNKFDVIFPKTVEINEIESNNTTFKNELATYTV
jgi:hypothetical protein